MGGSTNPIEWVVPPVAIAHMSIDEGLKASKKLGGPDLALPPAPGSPDDKTDEAAAAAEANRQKLLSAQAQAQEEARTQAAQDLAARIETPQEAMESRRRAIAASQALGGGRRRASQTLTDPGSTLSGSY